MRLIPESRTSSQARIKVRYDEATNIYKVVLFNDNHNHELNNPSAQYMLNSNQHIESCEKMISKINRDVGILIKCSYEFMS